MSNKSTALNLVIQAAEKINARTPEWRNVLAFIQSCYCGRVCDYDLEGALASLARLTDEEQHALIAWAMMADETSRQAA